MRLRFLLPILLLLMTGCHSSSGVYHTVVKGQTLYRISRAYDVDERYLARINGVGDPTELPVGKRLFIPGAKKLIAVPATVIERAPAAAVAKSSPATPPPPRPASRPMPKSTAVKSTAKPVKSPAKPLKRVDKSVVPKPGHFIWPLRGKVVRNFCLTGKDPCKGLEIAVDRGTPVLASSAGKIIYSGDGIRGYGNLIIVRHDGDFFSVYGFNDKNLVSSGSFVSKGQKIALSGRPPSGGQPRLHFELRKGKESVNPTLYLP